MIEPATGNALATVGVANAEDVAKSAASAKAAQTQWANRAPQERAAVLRRAADLFGRYQHEIARWLVREAGGVRAKSEFEILQTINFTMEAAAIASQPPGLVLPSAFPRISLATRVPRGVIGIISALRFCCDEHLRRATSNYLASVICGIREICGLRRVWEDGFFVPKGLQDSARGFNPGETSTRGDAP